MKVEKQIFIYRFIILILCITLAIYAYNFRPYSINDSRICSDYSASLPSTMKRSLVKEMVDKYKKNQLTCINRGCNNDSIVNDARAIWFNLDTIKKFIYHVEKNAVENHTDPSKLGLRIYYSAYPNNKKWGNPGYEDLRDLLRDPITKEYEHKHTLVIIPTILNSENINADFNPLDRNTYGGFLNKVKNKDDDEKSGFSQSGNNGYKTMALSVSSTERESEGGIVARNHGTLIPPGTPSGLSF